MRGRRAAVIPYQGSVETEALASAARAQERAAKAANPSEDGDSREFTISIPISSDHVIVHGLKRKPRGWVVLSRLSSGASGVYESARSSTTITLTNPSPLVTAELRVKVY